MNTIMPREHVEGASFSFRNNTTHTHAVLITQILGH